MGPVEVFIPILLLQTVAEDPRCASPDAALFAAAREMGWTIPLTDNLCISPDLAL